MEQAVYKDIPQSFGIENPMMLERLLYVLAGQFTGVLSPRNLCQELDGMAAPTLDRYLSYLERTFLVFRLTNYAGNEGQIQKRGRKLYFLDGAIRNAALSGDRSAHRPGRDGRADREPRRRRIACAGPPPHRHPRALLARPTSMRLI